MILTVGSAACGVLSLLFLFFLMIRRPPRSTLFPTRRSSDLMAECVQSDDLAAGFSANVLFAARSEEHTSELQSHSDLVCRLLLEKKNNTNRGKLDPYHQMLLSQ